MIFGFNPRLPGGRRHCRVDQFADFDLVSIHAFRGEGDVETRHIRLSPGKFQSTPSGGKATVRRARLLPVVRRFNPRLPGGRRLMMFHTYAPSTGFNPRLPGGRRPAYRAVRYERLRVSIHAFRGEGDFGCGIAVTGATRFNPRLPGGRRPGAGRGERACTRFNPRLPGGRRHANPDGQAAGVAFQSTPSGGKATKRLHRRVELVERVSIHAFRGEGDRARVSQHCI